MNDAQYKRYNRIWKQPLQCLFYMRDKNKNYLFLVNGSTDKHYKVIIDKKKGTIDCSCPDAQYAAKEDECLCKHCLHVLFRVLKIFKDCNHSFFRRRRFSPDELVTVSQLYRQLPPPKKR